MEYSPKIFSECEESVAITAEKELAPDIKENLSYVLLEYEDELQQELEQNYELPNFSFCLLASQLKGDVTRVIIVCEFCNLLFCLVYRRLL